MPTLGGRITPTPDKYSEWQKVPAAIRLRISAVSRLASSRFSDDGGIVMPSRLSVRRTTSPFRLNWMRMALPRISTPVPFLPIRSSIIALMSIRLKLLA
jgi:hypothetical protein